MPSSVKRKCHVKALSENLELSLIGGVSASGIDSYWVIMDTIHNGIQWHYIIIFIGLMLSTGLLSVALRRQHVCNVRQALSELSKCKKDRLKLKTKRNSK